MATYQRILLAVDLTDQSKYIGEKACELARALDAHIELLHVVEPVPPVLAGVDATAPLVMPTEGELVDQARVGVQKLAQELGIAATHWSIEVGTIGSEIVRVARARSMDLIVLGAHERHALAFLIKPTEDAVLHRAPCDVLAIRVPG